MREASFIDEWLQEKLREGLEKGRVEGLLEGLEKGRMEGLEKGRMEGLEKGRVEGLLEGLEKGRTEGFHDGRKASSQNILLRVLNHRFGKVPSEVFSTLTHLTPEQLEDLVDVALSASNSETFAEVVKHLPKERAYEGIRPRAESAGA